MEEPTAKESRWKRFREQSRSEYQLVVRNTHDYDAVGSYTLTPLDVYLAVSTVLLLVALLVYLLIAFTPLRQYIPGYGDVVQREQLNALHTNLAQLTSRVEAQDLYIDNLKRTVLGEAITADSVEAREELLPGDKVVPLPPSASEIKLRREMEVVRQDSRARTAAAPLPSAGDGAVPLAQVYLVAPVNGEISASFNLPSAHTGVDILAPQHTAIKATRAGIVFMSEFTSANGNVIGIQHDHNLISFYKHNSKLLKQVGDRVQAGEAIAIIGNTGTQSTGPHLHFELWHEGLVVDPREYISF